MLTDTQRRSQILKRISRIPKEKLQELDDFVSTLEQENSNKQKTLSLAGAWNDIDNSVFEDLTNNLINRRQTNRRRIDFYTF